MGTFGVRELAPVFLFWCSIPGIRQVSTQEHVIWNLPFTKCKFCKSFLLILIHHWWGGRVYRLCSTAIPPFPTPCPIFFHFHAHSIAFFALFCTQYKLNSFVFNRF